MVLGEEYIRGILFNFFCFAPFLISHSFASISLADTQDVDPPEQEAAAPPPAAAAAPAAAPSKTASSSNNGEEQTAPVKREENINIHNRVRQQRAQNIFSTPIDMNEEFQTPRYPKSDAAVQFIDGALEDNFIFASLTSKERRLLIDAMMMEAVPAGTVIIKQGETGDFFYVVEEGHVSFAVDGTHVGSTGRGGSFGELALLCKLFSFCSNLLSSACCFDYLVEELSAVDNISSEIGL